MSAKEASPAGPQPLIPEKYLDVPSQRLYYLSFGFLCQVSMEDSKQPRRGSPTFFSFLLVNKDTRLCEVSLFCRGKLQQL